MTPEQRAQQQQHAADIRTRGEYRRLTDEQKAEKNLEALIDRRAAIIAEKIAERVANALIAKFTIQSGQNINFSGTGFNITGNVQLPPPPTPSPKQTMTFKDCDENVFEIEVISFTPAP